jgi:hypothetical protein
MRFLRGRMFERYSVEFVDRERRVGGRREKDEVIHLVMVWVATWNAM